MRKQNMGITLIALILTIIILLILAGISISALTGNGLFEKVKLAKQNATEAEVKEKIELLLYEYQMEKINNNQLSLFDYLKQKKENREIDTLKDNEDGTIKVGLKGYTVTINEEELTIINIEVTNDIEFSYELTAYENNKFKILIKISDKANGINTIQYPDGDIQKCNGKEEVAIDYEVDEGVDYVFIAKNSNGIERREVINFIKPVKPIIPDVSVGYLTLTLTGAKNPKIEINYDEREEFINYYSLDNGVTWNLYSGSIEANSSNIMAKSVHKKCKDIFEVAEKSVTSSPGSFSNRVIDGDSASCDVINCYEGDDASSDKIGCSFNVDESLWGQNLCINYSLITANPYGASPILGVSYYDKNGSLKYFSTLLEYGGGSNSMRYFEIPEGIYKIRLYTSYSVSATLTVYELSINSPLAPIIKAEYDETKVNKSVLDLPLITSNGVKNCSINPEIGTEIKLEVVNDGKNGIENYYSLDGGNTWNLYTDIIRTTYQGEGLIQAKSVNKYYKKESEITELNNYIKDLNIECSAPDAVTIHGYDGDEDTASSNRRYMRIDDSAIGKRLKLKYESYGNSTIHLTSVYDVLAGTAMGEYGINTSYLIIPQGAVTFSVRPCGWYR